FVGGHDAFGGRRRPAGGPGGRLVLGWTDTLRQCLAGGQARGLDRRPGGRRGRVQVRELCRLLGLPRGIGELGCVHLEGSEVRYELGPFPFHGETPVEAMVARGVLDLLVTHADLEPHDPWNEGREATLILRGTADVAAANRLLAERGFSWCVVIDNGALFRRPGHAYHLAPAGTGKA